MTTLLAASNGPDKDENWKPKRFDPAYAIDRKWHWESIKKHAPIWALMELWERVYEIEYPNEPFQWFSYIRSEEDECQFVGLFVYWDGYAWVEDIITFYVMRPVKELIS